MSPSPGQTHRERCSGEGAPGGPSESAKSTPAMRRGSRRATSSGVVPFCHRCQKSRTRPTLSRSAASTASTARASRAERRPGHRLQVVADAERGADVGHRPDRVGRDVPQLGRGEPGGPAVRPSRRDGSAEDLHVRHPDVDRQPGQGLGLREHGRSLVRSPALDIGQRPHVHRSQAVERLAQAGDRIALGEIPPEVLRPDEDPVPARLAGHPDLHERREVHRRIRVVDESHRTLLMSRD